MDWLKMSSNFTYSCWKNEKADWSKSFFHLKSLSERYVVGLLPESNLMNRLGVWAIAPVEASLTEAIAGYRLNSWHKNLELD